MLLDALRGFRPDVLLTGPIDALLADALSVILRVPAIPAFLQPIVVTSEAKSMFGEPMEETWLAAAQ